MRKISIIHVVFPLSIIFLFIISCKPKQVKVLFSEWELVASGMNFPEGPAWDGSRTLYVSNCYGGWIARINGAQTDTFLISSPQTFDKTNGLMVYKDGCLYACDYGAGAILNISPGGIIEIYADSYQGQSFSRPNDLVFDRHGNLYFTDPKSYSREIRDGRIFRIERNTKAVSLAADELAFPNGIAFSPVDEKLYVCESANQRIVRFDVQSDGKLSNKSLFIELPAGDPDGMTFDNRGNLYVAHFGGGMLYVISPKGEILHKITTPGEKPTNVTFGGSDMQTLFLTEAETNSVYQVRLNVAGIELRQRRVF